ncbi:MAG: hypothetical protein HC783_14495 [Rhodobacteraceae bacterium]|nr:hypothetical protein [Paracoccaceae bacterium]
MEVSHFELIWKPQSPATPIGQSGIDKVFQGYFLEITNLEAVDYTYAIEFVVAPGAPPERNLIGNTVVFIDTPGVNNAPGVLNGNAAGTVFSPSTGNFTIPANGTALVAVLPSAFQFPGPNPLDPTPLVGQNFEVRGYVRLRLPTVFRAVQLPNGTFAFRRVAQANGPVKVLLTPQNRSTYYATNGTLSDQTQASLPTASGAARNDLPPDQPIVIVVPAVLDIDAIKITALQTMIDQVDPGLAMAALLASIDPEKSDLAAMNASLAKAGIGVAVERRKQKA